MTRLQSLIELRDKVKAGEILQSVDAVDAFPMTPDGDVTWLHACKASQGSLDAAKALHEAVLPMHDWCVTNDASHAGDEEGPCAMIAHELGGVELQQQSPSPARAWLLAILESLIAKEAPE
jgi:hypothetical protein